MYSFHNSRDGYIGWTGYDSYAALMELEKIWIFPAGVCALSAFVLHAGRGGAGSGSQPSLT